MLGHRSTGGTPQSGTVNELLKITVGVLLNSIDALIIVSNTVPAVVPAASSSEPVCCPLSVTNGLKVTLLIPASTLTNNASTPKFIPDTVKS